MSDRDLKPMSASRLYMAEIVGESSLQGQRMQAGAILDLMDILAGRVAHTHAASPVVTLSFDRVDLTQPILHEDMVRLEGTVAHVGRSSIMVAVEVFRQDAFIRQFIPIQRSYVTMVAVDADRRPNRDIPGLALDSEADRMVHEAALRQKSHAQSWQDMQEEVRRQGPFRAAQVEEPFNRDKREWLSPVESEVQVCRQFMPRNTNVHGTIFGGDILLWMDRVATYTARRFTRNRNMVTLAMNRIFFREPIFAADLVDMTARVVYVRNFTLEVQIEVMLQRGDGEAVRSHSGYFTILNFDEAGFKRPIVTGLRLEDADQDALMRYRQAHRRHEFWRDHIRPKQGRAL